MTPEQSNLFEYDVALSFAGEDVEVAEQFASLLVAKQIKVFFDDCHTVELGGSDFLTHTAELCRIRARYCVMFISQHYPLEKWTEAERTSVQQHALRDADEYILPITLDDTKVPGVTETTGYKDLRQHSMESIVEFLEQRLTEMKGRSSGPPSKSHDLRSGNIPPKQQ